MSAVIETDRERRLREELAEARFQNTLLTWAGVFFFVLSLLLLAWR